MVKAMLLVSVLVLGLTWSLSVQADHDEQHAHGTAEPSAHHHDDHHHDHHNDTHDTHDAAHGDHANHTDHNEQHAHVDHTHGHNDTAFNKTEDCHAPPMTGPCKAHMEHYFYNSTSMHCEKFVYGGCDGNHNNFETEAECMHACHDDADHGDHKDHKDHTGHADHTDQDAHGTAAPAPSDGHTDAPH